MKFRIVSLAYLCNVWIELRDIASAVAWKLVARVSLYSCLLPFHSNSVVYSVLLQAIDIFIFESWKVKLIGDMKWNPIRSDNFRGFQWNVVNKQTHTKHGGELITFSGDHHKYSKFLVCGIVYAVIILPWQLILLVLWSKGKFNEIDRQIKNENRSVVYHTLLFSLRAYSFAEVVRTNS